MTAKTKQMPSAYFLSPHKYSDSQAEALLEILRPHLLPAYRKKAKQKWIVDEVQKAVGLLSSSYKRNLSASDTFNLRTLKQLQQTHSKFAALLELVDEATVEMIELKLTDGSPTSEYLQIEAQRLGIETSSPLLVDDVVSHAVAVNDYLLAILDLYRDLTKKHRPQDTMLRNALFELYDIYKLATGKKAAVGGVMQEFMEAAIAPIVPATKCNLTSYARELQKRFSGTEGKSAKK